jgi:hypothetical protein
MPQSEDDLAAREYADSIPVQDGAPEDFAPQQGGHVIVRTRGSGDWDVTITRRPGLNEDDQESLDAWARDRVYRLIMTGTPELDGWFKRPGDDGWQITARDGIGVDPSADSS